jgi:hypothetical protein
MKMRRALVAALLVGGYLTALAGVALAGYALAGPLAGLAIVLLVGGGTLLTLGWFAYEELQ